MSLEGQDLGERGYLGHIDGLRAVAVLAVMLFHADPTILPGGFAGVDVFLVISGYLITRIIVRDAGQGQFLVAGFYLNRAKRILPALSLVLVASLIAALVVANPREAQAFGANLAAATLFLANFYSWHEGEGYFAVATARMPLAHLWSLAVEEQFYLLYPLALLVLLRRWPERTFGVLAAAALVSLVLSQVIGASMPSANYYLLPTRAWELLVGALLALAAWRPVSRPVAQSASIAGIVLVLGSIALQGSGTPFPGLSAVPVVLGTALLIYFGASPTFIGGLLESKPLRCLGLISYSAFLWHQPLLAFARIYSLQPLGIAAELMLVMSSFFLAWPSWRFVEQPFRRHGRLRRGMALCAIPLTLVLLLAAGLLLFSSGGWPQRLPERARALLSLADGYRAGQASCYFGGGSSRNPQDACVVGARTGRAVAIFGDSHAAAIAPAFAAAAAAQHWHLLLFTASACPPIDGFRSISRAFPDCRPDRTRILHYIRRHPEIDIVVLAGRWTARFSKDGGGDIDTMLTGEATSPAGRGAMARGLRRTITSLLEAGKRVVLIYPIPQAGWDVPVYLARAEQLGVALPQVITTDATSATERDAEAARALDSIGNMPGLIRAYPALGLCGVRVPGRCTLAIAGRPLYFDDHHLTAEGAREALPNAAQLLARFRLPKKGSWQ